jgi:MFS family permease
MLRQRFTGLWRHADFIRVWIAQTVSVFGSLIGGPALAFTAILILHTPFQLGVLAAARLAPGVLTGLFAGAWADRLRRRPIMIGADIGRAMLLATIPVAAVLGLLRVQQLWVVTFLVGVLTVVFDVAYQSLWTCPLCGGLMHAVERFSAAQLFLRSPPHPGRYAA